MAENKSLLDYLRGNTTNKPAESTSKKDLKDYLANSKTATSTRQSGGLRDHLGSNLTSSVGNNITNRVNTWLQGHNTYISDYQNRYSGRKFNYEDSYVSDSASWLDTASKRKSDYDTEAESILSYMDQYKDYLDADWMKDVKKTIADARKQQGTILESYTKDNEWWSLFTPNEEQTAAGYTSDKVYKEWQEERKQYAEDMAYDVEAGMLELEELKKGRDAYLAEQEEKRKQAQKDESFWDSLGRWLGTTPDTTLPLAGVSNSSGNTNPAAEYDKQIAELEAKIERSKRVQLDESLSKKYGGMTGAEIDNALATLEDGEEREWLESNQHDLYKNDPDYNSLAASGWKSYEAQMIAAQQKEDNKSFWEILAETYANAPADTSLPAAGIANAQASYRNDTSYRHPNENWSEDQKNHFGYLYSKNQAKAYAYAEQVNNDINAGKKYEQQQSVQNWATQNVGTGIVGTLGAIATAPLGLVDLLDDMVEYSARGTITQKGVMTPFEYSQATTSGITNKLNEHGTIDDDVSVFGGKGWGDVYSLGVSAANSLVSAYALGGTGTLVNFIGQGGAAGVDDALSRGATAEQALLYGAIVGAAEGLTEMIPAEKLIKVGSSATFKNFLKKALKQGVGEFAEEGVSAILGNVADNFIMQDKSNFNALVEKYMIEEGLSEREAKNKAWKKLAGDAVYDAIGGFATGMGNAIVAGGASTAIDARKGNQKNINAIKQYGDKTGDLIQEGLESDVKSESYNLATKYQQQVAGKNGKQGKALTGFQIRNLLAANQDQIKPKDMKLIQQAAQRRLTALGQTGEVEKLAEYATKWATGKQLTRAEKSLLANSEYGARVANELLPKNIASEGYATEWAEEIGTRKVNAEAYNKKKLDTVRGILDQMANMEDPNAYKNLDERLGEKITEEAAKQVSSTGKAVIRSTGEEINLSDPKIKAFTEDGTILEVNGKEINSQDIDFASTEQAYAFSAVAQIENVTPVTASAMLAEVDFNKPVGAQLNGMDEAFTYGYYGYSEQDLSAGSFTGALTQKQLNDAYKLGQYVRGKSDMNADAPIVKMRTEADAKLSEEQKLAKQKSQIESDDAEVYFMDGKSVVKFDEHTGKYDKKRKAAVNTAKFLSKLGIGGKYYFYESYENVDGDRVYKDANGNEVEAPNGFYKDADGSIFIDLNAGEYGQGVALYTLGHELTHFVKAQSKKQFKILSDFVTEAFDKTDMSMRERVLAKQKFLEDKRGESVSYDEAYEEVVADAMSTMLSDGSFHEKLMEIKVKDKGLFNTIKRFFEKMIAKFTKVYEELTPDQKDAQDIREVKDMFDKIQTAFAEALVEASENFQAAGEQKNTTQKGDVKFSQRNFNKTVNNIVYSDDSAPFDYRNVYMGETPQSLLDIGFIQLPMTITSKHIYTIANKDGRFTGDDDHYHNLGASRVMELPELLKKPVATFVEKENPRRVVIVTSKVNDSGKPIMVAVEYSGQTGYKTATNEVLIYANPVTTALGKKDGWFESQINNALQEGRMLQADKERSQESPSGLWSQCPESLWSSDFTTNIEQFKQNVKRFLPKEKQIRKSWNAVRESEETTTESDRNSERGDNSSNRFLLANAFEGISQNSVEYEMIQEYRKEIGVLNRLDVELQDLNQQIRDIRFSKGLRDNQQLQKLEEKAARIARDISRKDKQLLNMEASAPLRRVIEQERKKAAKKTREHVEQILQNRKDRAERTELRKKIRKTVNDLDKLLKKNSKQQNVKEDMKGFASKALKLADYLFTDHLTDEELIRNGITVGMDERQKALVKETEEILGALYDRADSLTDEDFTRLDKLRKENLGKLKDVLLAQRNERLNTTVYQLFDDLVTEYAKLRNSEQTAVKTAYDPEVERFLRSYIGDEEGQTDADRKTALKNMRVADMTTEELWKLLNAYTAVLHTVRNANKLFVQGKAGTLEQTIDSIISDVSSRKKVSKGNQAAIRNIANKLGWSYEKLYYALDRIGSDAFTQLVMNIADSENTVMRDVMEAVAFRDRAVEKYGLNNWAMNKKLDRVFLDNNGKEFELTLGEMMSLYAYSRRKGAWDHIQYGGFAFGKTALTDPNPADTYKLTREQVEAITDLLTPEQKGFAEEMQKFLSETMGAKGNEVSMQLYGIKLFTEENYFPIRTAGQYKAKAQESQAKQAAGFGTMSNAGFTKAQNPKAKAPFVLEGFMDIWADHVHEMSRYHGTVPALEDYRRVTNYSEYMKDEENSTAFRAAMENAYGKEAMAYFDDLYREANSGAIQDKLEKTSKKLLSLFRKNSVAYSLSVLVQQPASLSRAYAMIDRKYFTGLGFGALPAGLGKALSSKWNKAYAEAYNEMLQYAPGVTMTKEIGGFDTATGGSIRSYLLDTGKSAVKKWSTGNAKEKLGAVADAVDDNPIANLPNVADKIAWIEIWNACKRETLSKNPSLSPKSEEFMQAAGARFTEVIRATQVYDSIFAKSPLLKSKSQMVQMLVSFMNEPNTVANMAENAVRELARGNRKQAAKTAGALVNSILVTNLLKSLVYAMRDDDEDESYIEKYFEAVAGNLINDIVPLNYVPFARDVWSAFQGYDVERTDMAVVSDAIDAVTRIVDYKWRTDTSEMTGEQLSEYDKKVTEATWNLAYAIATFFGVPLKNIRRDVKAIINTFAVTAKNAGVTTKGSWNDQWLEAVADSIPFMKAPTKQDKLYNAIIDGDTQYVERLKATYKTEEAYENAVRKALRENDPRIQEIAQAKYDGRNWKDTYYEIRNEGIFEPAVIVDAVNSAYKKIKDKAEGDSGTVQSEYTVAQFVELYAIGDTEVVTEAKDDIINTKVANGMSREEAKESFAKNVSTSARDAFDNSTISEKTAKDILQKHGGMSREEAAEKVSYWQFVKDNPLYREDLNESRVEKYREYAQPAKISLKDYLQFAKTISGYKDIKDKDGKVVTSTKTQVIDLIDSMNLTKEQKDALYLASGYKESTLKDVKWK